MKTIRKALVDDLGVVVGTMEVKRGDHSIVKYGGRDRHGILHVIGLARLTNFSDLSKTDLAYTKLYAWLMTDLT